MLLYNGIFATAYMKQKLQEVFWLHTNNLAHGGAGKQNNFKFVIVQAIKQILHPLWKPYLPVMDMLQTFNLYFKRVILLIMSHPQAM